MWIICKYSQFSVIQSKDLFSTALYNAGEPDSVW